MTDATVHHLGDRQKPAVVKDQAPPSIDENLEAIAGQVRKLREELAEARQELHEAETHAAELADALEDRGRQDIFDHDSAVGLFEEIHRERGHGGPWNLCRDDLCHRFEAWSHDRQRDLDR